MIKINREALAYVAGLYEGEGYCGQRFHRSHNINRYRVDKTPSYKISIQQDNIEPLKKVHDIIKFGKIYGPYTRSSNNKQYYVYEITGFEKVQAFLTMIWQHLSPRRQEQACDCLGRYYIGEYDYD